MEGCFNLSTSWLGSTKYWPQNGKQIQCGVCSTKDLNVQSAKWSFVSTWIRFKCLECNVGLCFDPCLWVFHTKSQFSCEHLIGKSISQKCKYHFSLCTNIFWLSMYFIQRG